MPSLAVPGDVRIRTDKRMDEFVTPFSDVTGAAFEGAYRENPLQSLNRMQELGEERFGTTEVLPAPATAGIMPGDPALGDPVKPQPRTPLVSAEEARARIKEEGVKLDVPDSGIPHGALQILIDRKKAEMRRQDAIQRSSSDILTQGARFGTALAASVLDPINVGLAFVPAVGPTRYALMVERAGGALGRAAVRAGVGAVEGAAGAAIVEPLIYAAGRADQADYTLTDSLLNIAFGTAFGGGLHVGGGAVADAVNWRVAQAKDGLSRAIAEASPETREAALRTAVAQVVEGRAVEIAPVLRADPVIEAWHGSPHRFEAFSMERVGTGEGAQVYGHGLYFAARRSVAESYQFGLSDHVITIGGKTLPIGNDRSIPSTALQYVRAAFDAQSDNPFQYAKRMARSALGETSKIADDVSKQIDEWQIRGAEVQRGGSLYNVAIRADENRLLDWDKPLSEQPKEVRDLLPEISPPKGHEWNRDPSGGQIYQWLGNKLGGQQAASQALREAGIPGIKYLDAGSRDVKGAQAALPTARQNVEVGRRNLAAAEANNYPDIEGWRRDLAHYERTLANLERQAAGQGDRNYVIFDDSLIETRAINGEPVDQRQKAIDAARAAERPDSITAADFPAAHAAEAKLAEVPKLDAPDAPETLLADTLADIDALASQFGEDVSKSVKAELADYDSLIDTAEVMGRAARAAASCGLRKGL